MEEKVGDIPSMSGKAKIDWLKVGIAAGIVLAVILGIIWVMSISKSSALSTGDLASFEYSINSADGKVIYANTSQIKVGEISDFFGFASDKVDKALVNASIGKDIKIILSPEESFGAYDESKIIVQSRVSTLGNTSINEINRTFEIPSSAFKSEFGEDAVLNKVYTANLVMQKVIAVSNDSIKLSYENKAGDKIPRDTVGLMYTEIVEVTADKLKIRLGANEKNLSTQTGDYEIKISGIYITSKWTPEVGKEVSDGYSSFMVKSVNETSVVLDANSPYSVQNITLTIKALKIVTKSRPAVITNSDTCYGKYGISSKDIVFVHASWCPHCQKMKPIVQELTDSGELIFSLEEQDANFQAVVDCLGGFDGYPTFICAGSQEKKAGEMTKEELQAFAQSCSLGTSTAPEGIKTTGTTDAKYLITDQEICKENGKPIVYFFGADFCPHCRWEHPIFNETLIQFKDYVSLHDNMGTQNDYDIFAKFNPEGTIPTVVLGCKYMRVGTTGQEDAAGEAIEKAALTKLLCELTGNKPADACK